MNKGSFFLQQKVNDIHIDPPVQDYIKNIFLASRDPKSYGLKVLAPYIDFGTSLSCSIDLQKVSRAYAMINDRDYVTPVDVAFVCNEVLRNRIILSTQAQDDGITTDYVINKILEALPHP
ncbi:MAG: MoxR-like ATPase [Sulfurimonas sp.]|jgi:MoxR-like ATPase